MYHPTGWEIGGVLAAACVASATWDSMRKRRSRTARAGIVPVSRLSRVQAWMHEHGRDPFDEWDNADRQATVLAVRDNWADDLEPVTPAAVYKPADSTHTVVMAPPSDAEVYAAAMARNEAYKSLSGEHSRPVDGPRRSAMLESRPRPEPSYRSWTSQDVDNYIKDMERRTIEFNQHLKDDTRKFMVELIGAARHFELEAEKELARQ